MADRPITGATWDVYEIVGYVVEDAMQLNFGLLLPGAGEAWMDAVSLTVIETQLTTDPPPALSERGLMNLMAFTRLVGYVRYFHPCDEAAHMDWGRFVMAGVSQVEDAEDSTALVATLRRLFRPIAPSVRILPAADPAPADASTPESDATGSGAVVWVHNGVRLEIPGTYSSTRSPDGLLDHDRAWILQEVDARTVRGQRVRFEVSARLDEPTDRAEVWVSALGAFGTGQTRTVEPVIGDTWRGHAVEVRVPEVWVTVCVGATLYGRGRICLSEARLSAIDAAGDATPIPLENAGFDDEGNEHAPRGWLAERVGRGPYGASVVGNDPASGRRCLAITSLDERIEGLPGLGEAYAADLGGGVNCVVPLALSTDARGTLPRTLPEERARPIMPPDLIPTGEDRRTRITAVILAWNVFQHFYPYFDVVDTDWPSVLRTSLQRAATDSDEHTFARTLRLLVAELQDGHGNVFAATDPPRYYLPLGWAWVEGRLVITNVPVGADGPDLSPGDVVESLDGQPTEAAVAETERAISSATPQHRRLKALQTLAVGSKDEPVTLEIRSSDGAERRLTVGRTAPAMMNPNEPRPDPVTEIAAGLFYLDVSRVPVGDLMRAMPRLAEARGVIVDLRGYPRPFTSVVLCHLTGEPLVSAQWRVPRVMRPDRSDMTFDTGSFSLEPREPRIQGRAIFITDARAYSQSETLLGIVKHHGLAEIVGEPTAGTNGNINMMMLPGGYRAIWTGMQVLNQDGSQHHGVGIQPTIPVSRTIAGVAAGRDELLEAAIQAVAD